MTRLTYIFVLFVLIMTGCNKYFKPTGIIDRTEEFSGKNIWVSLNDKERIDGYTRIGNSIFGGEIACNIEPLKNIDIETFQVLAGTQYAKDKNNVYYPIEIPCIDLVDCGVCFYSRIIVEEANPTDFEYLEKDYATSGNMVFFRGILLKSADGETFKVIEGPRYFYFATDKNNVYNHNKIVEGADPSTFYYDDTDSRNVISEIFNKYIIGDKNNKWEYLPPDEMKKIE